MGLWAYIGRRLVLAVLVLFIVSLATFGLVHALPGSPIDALIGERQANNPTVRAEFERRWGLDKPLVLQYIYYVQNLLRGDLGISISSRRPVTQELRQFVPATIELSVAAMAFALAAGLPLGVLAAVRLNRWPDHAARFIALIGTSVPVFTLGLLASYVFYYRLQWLPRQG